MLLALLGALAIGITLGLLGSGGSVITVPVLVFILQRPEKPAIAESLVIVGIVALIGSIPYMLRSQVQWSSVLFFGLPGMLGACIGGCGPYFISGNTQLTFFACVILVVGVVMLFNQAIFDKLTIIHRSVWLTMVEGFFIGCLMGFLGIGGGFLIVPSLIMLCNLSIPFAVGTSLIIIAMNSFTGFLGQLYFLNLLHLSVDWEMICFVSLAGIAGSLSGGWLSAYIPQVYIRKVFGIGVLSLGVYILARHFLI